MAAQQPSAPLGGSTNNQESVTRIFKRLSLLFGRRISLDSHDVTPNSNPNDIKLANAVRFLFWADREGLEMKVDNVRRIPSDGPLKPAAQKHFAQTIFACKDLLMAERRPQQPNFTPASSTMPQEPRSSLVDSKITAYMPISKRIVSATATDDHDPRKDSFIGSKFNSSNELKRSADNADAPNINSDKQERSVKRQRTQVDLVAEEDKAQQILGPEDKGKLMSWKIKEMPLTGFGIKMIENQYSLPFSTSWDLLRAYRTFPDDTAALSKIANDKQLQKELERLNELRGNRFDVKSLFSQTETQQTTRVPTLTASLTVNDIRDDPAFFSFTPKAIRLEDASRIQRKFGWQRVLYVDVDMEKTLPGYQKSEKDNIKQQFLAWLRGIKKLLGWQWQAFHLQKASEQRLRNHDFQWRVVFFAVKADGFMPISLEHLVLKWMIPAKHNAKQPACKAYSRIDLALSRTTAAHTFAPEQIKLIADLHTTTTVYQDQFLDTDYTCKHRPLRSHDQTEVMTDGCAMLSVGAAIMINSALGVTTQPAAYQARIAGSKGMWHISAGYDTVDPHHLDVWIEIRESQVKVRHHSGAHCRLFSEGLDPLFRKDETLFTFDVNRYSKAPSTGDIHKDLLGIMEDRGVDRQAIMDLAKDALAEETQAMLEGTTTPVAFARQIQRYLCSDRLTADSTLSPDSATRLWTLLHHGGFMPDSIRFVADEYLRLCAQAKIRALTNVRIPCAASCMLLGIPDPYGILQEGEVHVRLSGLSSGGQSIKHTVPNGKNVLIARDPTLRASDVQKFQAVDHAKLSHLLNVVVFSTKGSMPAAAKLQGGDYDGDIFSVIWDPTLVEGFKNAPVLETASIASVGITKDKTLLKKYLPELGVDGDDLDIKPKHVLSFLNHVFNFKLNESLLGVVTNYFYGYINSTRELSSSAALDLIDLHDHLNDEAKNGYRFQLEDWHRFLKDRKLSKSCNAPAWQRVSKELDKGTDAANRSASDEEKKDLCTQLINFQHRTHAASGDNMHILDHLFFKLLLKTVKRDMQTLKDALQKVTTTDPDLTFAWEEFCKLYADRKGEPQAIESEVLKQIGEVWKSWPAPNSSFNMISIRKAVAAYGRIQPRSVSKLLSFCPGQQAITVWERLRACILMRTYSGRRHKAVFWLAWRALCAMKKDSNNGRAVLQALVPYMKVKKPQLALAGRLKLASGAQDLADGADIDDIELEDDDAVWDDVMQHVAAGMVR